jgi:hypothetical protein
MVVLTSASCLKPGRDVDGALAAQINFVPGQTQAGPGSTPTQPQGVKSYQYYEMPTVFYDQVDSDPDYAAVFFRVPVSNAPGFLGVTLGVVPAEAEVAGYATTAAGDGASQALWQVQAAPTTQTARRLGLPVAYDAGLSGAPVIEVTPSGLGSIEAIAVAGDAGGLSATRLLASDATLINDWLGLTPPTQPSQTGWWWSPSEPGRGYFIEVANGRLFMVTLGYGSDGSPTWLAASGAMDTAQHFQSALVSYGGGSPIAGSYRAPTQSQVVGAVAVDFLDGGIANLTTPWGGRGIQRFSIVTDGTLIGAPGPPYPENGFWWNPAAPGIGVVVEVQGSTMMVATLDYDMDGRASWAFAENSMIVPLLFAAPSTIIGAGPPDSGPWQPVGNIMAGQVIALVVKATDQMTLMLNNGAVTMPLSRFHF